MYSSQVWKITSQNYHSCIAETNFMLVHDYVIYVPQNYVHGFPGLKLIPVFLWHISNNEIYGLAEYAMQKSSTHADVVHMHI